MGEYASARAARQALDASGAENEATLEGARVLLAARAPPGVGRLEHLKRATQERVQGLIVVAPSGLDAAVGADGVGLSEHGGRVATGREMSPMLVVARASFLGHALAVHTTSIQALCSLAAEAR
jgi:hypothetical protein